MPENPRTWTPPTFDNEAPPPTQGQETKLPERASVKTPDCLSDKNQGFFGMMSEGGKEIATRAYEGLYKIPGVSMVVGKLGIAYNQFWLDSHEKRGAGLKEKIEGLDVRCAALDQSKKEIVSVIENLQLRDTPGTASLQLKLKDIDRQRTELLGEKDKTQSMFESRTNKVKLYTNERDRIADKLIARYDEQLIPMGEELARLQTYKEEVDLSVAVTEAKHKQQLSMLAAMGEGKIKIEQALRRTGMSEKEVRDFEGIRALEKALAQGREKVQDEREHLKRQTAKINKKIAEIDARANPYRDRREEFIRIKEGRPLEMVVEPRIRSENFTQEETVEGHPREKAKRMDDGSNDTLPEEGGMGAVETEEEDTGRIELANLITGWNVFLTKNTVGNVPNKLLINQKDFLKATKLSERFTLDGDDFKNILTKYYRLRKLPVDTFPTFTKSIDAFLKEEK